ncbi:MAG: hypothetical protein AAF264_01210 [Pseudomonadota bacterium]
MSDPRVIALSGAQLRPSYERAPPQTWGTSVAAAPTMPGGGGVTAAPDMSKYQAGKQTTAYKPSVDPNKFAIVAPSSRTTKPQGPPPTLKGWTYEKKDDNVANHLGGLMKSGSPLMKQAETKGLQIANARGLLNSSMAAGAVQGQAYEAAVPLAQQTASQANSENLTNLQIDGQITSQNNAIRSDWYTQGRDIDSREYMQGRDLTSRSDLLDKELGSRATLLDRELTARFEELSKELGSRSALQAAEYAFLQQQNGADRALKTQLAQWDVSESQRQLASQMLLGFDDIYSTQVNNILANRDMDAASRTKYLESAKNLRDSQLDLVQQLLGVSLDWGQA